MTSFWSSGRMSEPMSLTISISELSSLSRAITRSRSSGKSSPKFFLYQGSRSL